MRHDPRFSYTRVNSIKIHFCELIQNPLKPLVHYDEELQQCNIGRLRQSFNVPFGKPGDKDNVKVEMPRHVYDSFEKAEAEQSGTKS